MNSPDRRTKRPWLCNFNGCQHRTTTRYAMDEHWSTHNAESGVICDVCIPPRPLTILSFKRHCERFHPDLLLDPLIRAKLVLPHHPSAINTLKEKKGRKKSDEEDEEEKNSTTTKNKDDVPLAPRRKKRRIIYAQNSSNIKEGETPAPSGETTNDKKEEKKASNPDSDSSGEEDNDSEYFSSDYSSDTLKLSSDEETVSSKSQENKKKEKTKTVSDYNKIKIISRSKPFETELNSGIYQDKNLHIEVEE